MTKTPTAEERTAWLLNLPGKLTSACLAVRHKDTVLMVKANYKNYWTFPGGLVDENESPKQAALRETSEETGLKIDGDSCEPLGTVYSAPYSIGRDRLTIGFVTDIAEASVDLAVPNDEIDEAKWVPISDIDTLSGGKESYKIFRAILLGELPLPSYAETN